MSLTQLQTFATTSDERDFDSRATLGGQVDYVVRNAGTIGDGSIQGGPGGHIAASSITAGSIAAGSITADRIEAGSITAVQIQARAITADRIQAGSITASEITTGTITSALIKANTITAANIATGTLTGDLVAAGTLTGDRLVTDTITATQIVGTTLSGIFADLGTVTAGTLRIGAIGGNKVAIGDSISTSVGTKQGLVGTDSANAITFWLDSATGNLELKGTIKSGSTGLGNIAGAIHGTSNIISGTVAGDRLVANSITAGQIDASSVRSVVLVANSITTGMLQAGSVKAAQIEAGAITAAKISAIIAGQNMLSNATTSFELDTDGWATTDGGWGLNPGATKASTSDGVAYGRSAMRVLTSGTSAYQGVAVTAIPGPYLVGQNYTFSVWLTGTGNPMILNLGEHPTSVANDYASATVYPVGTPSRFQAIWTPTATCSQARIAISTASTQNVVFYVDAPQIEHGDVATAWKQHIAPAVIEGSTITAGTIRTAYSGARVQLDTGGLHVYDSGGAEPVALNASVGLDLLAGTDPAPSADRRIRFMSGGAGWIEVYGFKDAAATVGRLDAFSDPTHIAYSLLRSLDNAGNIRGSVYTHWRQGSGYGSAEAQANGFNRVLIDSNGYSDFQLNQSDARDKHAIEPLALGALDRVRGLRPVEYNWNDKRGPAGRQAGLIAQEVAGVIPHAVQARRGSDSDRYTLEHSALIATLAGAVQELDQREAVTVADLRSVVLPQAEALGRLEARVRALEQSAPTANTNPPQ